MAGGGSTLLERLLGTLFPSRCLGCGLRGTSLCPDCFAAVPWLTSDVCPICCAPTRLARICHRCRQTPPVLDGSRAACLFEGVARRAIHDLKYRGVRSRATLLGDLAAETLDRRPLEIDLLVPVPLAPSRRRQRGFNQSELIARRLGERIDRPIAADVLARTRETPPQIRRTAAERLENVADAFVCSAPGSIAGRRVALMDDVMTTGATLNACAEALKVAGAARVYAIVVAREV
jgi:competence protein ComFC